MSKKPFSFAALSEYNDAISSSLDKYTPSAQQQLSIPDTEYMLQKNNCLVSQFNFSNKQYSNVIYNLKSRQIKTKEINPDRILCKGANLYYIRACLVSLHH